MDFLWFEDDRMLMLGQIFKTCRCDMPLDIIAVISDMATTLECSMQPCSKALTPHTVWFFGEVTLQFEKREAGLFWYGDLVRQCQHRTSENEERWCGIRSGLMWEDGSRSVGLTCAEGHHVTSNQRLETTHDVVLDGSSCRIMHLRQILIKTV